MKLLTLKVIDSNAYSDKHPNWGFCVDFVDNDGKEYYAEYPNFKSCKFTFENNCTYSFEASIKEYIVLGTTYRKLSRIKNVNQIK